MLLALRRKTKFEDENFRRANNDDNNDDASN